jgi:hypothetical protein
MWVGWAVPTSRISVSSRWIYCALFGSLIAGGASKVIGTIKISGMVGSAHPRICGLIGFFDCFEHLRKVKIPLTKSPAFDFKAQFF